KCSASGGIIDIVTRTAGFTQAGRALAGGSHNSRDLEGYGGIGNERQSHLFSFNVSDADAEDKRYPNDAKMRQALYTGHQYFNELKLQWGLCASTKEFGAWGFYSANYHDAREETEAYHTCMRADLPMAQCDTRTQVHCT